MRGLIVSTWRFCALLMPTPFAGPWPRMLAARQRRRLQRTTRLALHTLDTRTLHDLGIDPGEVAFLAARVGDARIVSSGEWRV